MAMSNVKQAGAAKRMPSGAILSGMRGAQYKGAQAMAEGGAALQPHLNQSMMNYQNLMNQYGMGQAQERNQMISDVTGTLGNMTAIGLLWKSGYFDQPGVSFNPGGGSGGGSMAPKPQMQMGPYGEYMPGDL